MNTKRFLAAVMLAVLTVPAMSQPVDGAGPQPDVPMAVIPVTITDNRVKNFVDLPDARETTFQIQARLRGSRIPEIIRLGTPIIEEMVDNNGQALIDPDQFTAVQRERTRPYQIPQGAIKQGFINMRIPTRVAPSRAAASIAKCRGYLWVVFGANPEPIFIRKPLSYRGGYLKHPRLDELGIRVRMLTEEEAPEVGADEQTIALAIETGEELIRNVTIYDDWLRNQNTRSKLVREGERKYNVYSTVNARVHNDCELALYVYPRVERLKIDFEWLNLELP